MVFHRLGKMVQDFWPRVSFGMLGYDMSRTQSIMRVATTASPISGAGVRTRMIELGNEQMEQWAARMMQQHYGFFRKLRKRAHGIQSNNATPMPERPRGGTGEDVTTAGIRPPAKQMSATEYIKSIDKIE